MKARSILNQGESLAVVFAAFAALLQLSGKPAGYLRRAGRTAAVCGTAGGALGGATGYTTAVVDDKEYPERTLFGALAGGVICTVLGFAVDLTVRALRR